MRAPAETSRAIPAGAMPAGRPVATWFEAALGGGRALLRLPGASAHAAQAATVLHRADAMLAAIDAWLGEAADWRWIAPGGPGARPGADGPSATDEPPAAERPSDAETLTAADTPPADARPWLQLPAAMRRGVPPPPDALHACLALPGLRAVAVLSRFVLHPGERAALEPGAAILIDGSFEARWTGWLRSADDGDVLPIDIDAPTRLRRIARDTGDSGPAGGAWCGDPEAVEIRLDFRTPLAAHLLAPGHAGVIDAPAGRAGLWRAGRDGRPLATGELIPWGGGWALLVEELHPCA